MFKLHYDEINQIWVVEFDGERVQFASLTDAQTWMDVFQQRKAEQ